MSTNYLGLGPASLWLSCLDSCRRGASGRAGRTRLSMACQPPPVPLLIRPKFSEGAAIGAAQIVAVSICQLAWDKLQRQV